MTKIRVYEDFDKDVFEEYENDHKGILTLFRDLTEHYWKWDDDDKWFAWTIEDARGNDKAMMELIKERQTVDGYTIQYVD